MIHPKFITIKLNSSFMCFDNFDNIFFTSFLKFILHDWWLGSYHIDFDVILPESWDTIVAAISSSRGSEKLKSNEIQDVVLSKSIHKRKLGDSSNSAHNFDQRGKSKSNDPDKSRSKSKDCENFQAN